MKVWRDRLTQFLFPIESDRWLSVLRFGLGLQVVLYGFSLRQDWNYLFAANGKGLITRHLSEALLSQKPFIPRLGWIINSERASLDEEKVLSAAWFVLLFAGAGLLLGFSAAPLRSGLVPSPHYRRRLPVVWRG
jgi:hypothetical protein